MRVDQLSRRLDWVIGLLVTSVLGQAALLMRLL
jgi:hypothetical protein